MIRAAEAKVTEDNCSKEVQNEETKKGANPKNCSITEGNDDDVGDTTAAAAAAAAATETSDVVKDQADDEENTAKILLDEAKDYLAEKQSDIQVEIAEDFYTIRLK